MKSKKNKPKKIYSNHNKFSKKTKRKIKRKINRKTKTKRKINRKINRKRKRKTKGKKLKGGMFNGALFPPIYIKPSLENFKTHIDSLKKQNPAFNPNVFFIICHGNSIPESSLNFSNNIIITPNKYRLPIPEWPEAEYKLYNNFLPHTYWKDTSTKISDKATNMAAAANGFIARSLDELNVPINSKYYLPDGRGSIFNFQTNETDLPDFNIMLRTKRDVILSFDVSFNPQRWPHKDADIAPGEREHFTLNNFIKELDMSNSIIVLHVCTHPQNEPAQREPITSGRSNEDQKPRPNPWDSPGYPHGPPLKRPYIQPNEDPSPFPSLNGPPTPGTSGIENPDFGIGNPMLPLPNAPNVPEALARAYSFDSSVQDSSDTESD